METVTDFISLGIRITVDGDCSLEIKRHFLFPTGSDGKESTQCRRPRFDPWIRKIPWRWTDNPLQYSCLENYMNKEAWRAVVHWITKSETQLSD